MGTVAVLLVFGRRYTFLLPLLPNFIVPFLLLSNHLLSPFPSPSLPCLFTIPLTDLFTRRCVFHLLNHQVLLGMIHWRIVKVSTNIYVCIPSYCDKLTNNQSQATLPPMTPNPSVYFSNNWPSQQNDSSRVISRGIRLGRRIAGY